ncbi:MAG TPA: hypothetical protein VFT22_19155 [Kofleriaceae bacterium]|nr:hypothetical protein [Kofleriaceae bacterium]
MIALANSFAEKHDEQSDCGHWQPGGAVSLEANVAMLTITNSIREPGRPEASTERASEEARREKIGAGYAGAVQRSSPSRSTAMW